MSKAYEVLANTLTDRGVDVAAVESAIKAFEIETPSWGYGNSGTRFGVFKAAGAARDLHERLSDAAQVNRVTGACPSVAIHIPWDEVEDFEPIKKESADLGVRIGAVNPNVFQADIYKFGSLTNVDAKIRQTAMDVILHCIRIMGMVDSDILSLWFADGSNYPGQVDMRVRKRLMQEALTEIHDKLPEDSRVMVEYKLFEPAFYHTDISDWGMSMLMCSHAGPNAQVLVDLGHHAQGVNIEHIVTSLIDEGMLGGFHFNNRKSADDDLTVGSINPYEVFLIFSEIIAGENIGLVERPIAYMIDQSHAIKQKLEAMIQSIMNIQTAYARALLIDWKTLADARSRNDAVDCERILQDAYETDVRPLLGKVREDLGLNPDPIVAHRESGYSAKIAEERVGELKGAASWG
jgi:L-rhamnose isomerase / sugar isomerase